MSDPALIYNLFPPLAGTFPQWEKHLDRIAGMGFTWIFLNPINTPGLSGSLYAVKALRKEGKKIGLLRLKTLWPFPGEEIQEVGEKVQKFIIPEMNLGQVAGEARKVFRGDVFSYSQTNGEVIGPEEIIAFTRRIGS